MGYYAWSSSFCSCSSAPLATAAGSGIAALGDAAAATSAGQAITAGLTPLVTAASTNIAGAPLYTWADAGLSSVFGAHGIQTAIDEGGISPTTALEIAPLGRLAKPIFNKAATAIENYRYPIGRPQVPENFLTVKPQVRTKIGDVEVNTPNMAYRQGNDLGRTYQKYKDVDASVAQHQIEDNFGQLQSAKHGKPYTNREAALDKAIADGTFDPVAGIEVDGNSAAFQDTPMYADGYLWHGTPKIDEVLEPGSLQSGLLVTPKNDAFIIGSNKATPYKGTGSGVVKSKSGITTVTDNGGRLIPADTDNLGLELNNISAYTWKPGYGYKKIVQEPSTSLAFFERNHPFKGKQLTEHVQGDEAVKMFKEYGGEPIPEGSINGEQLRKYVPEARERYGIVGDNNITDEEIAQALYKQSKELGGNTAAVNAQGEPQLLFRGDTKAYTELRNNHHESGGSEDNILGTLFLDRTGIGEGWGPDRYLYLSNKNGQVMAPYRSGIETGIPSLLKPKFKEDYLYAGSDAGYISDEQIAYPYWSYTWKSGETIQGNKIASDNFSDGTVNHLNAFIVRTPKVRDITNEVVVTGGSPGTPPPFNWLIPKKVGQGRNMMLGQHRIKQ